MFEKLTVGADASNMSKITDFLQDFLDKNNIDAKLAPKFYVVTDEIASNIYKYAYQDNEQGDITFELSIENNVFEMIFKDNGRAFNPLENEGPDISLGIDERNIGGLGLFIVKNLMDGIEYRREGNTNVLHLTKNL